jgi:hypothetical protein
MVIDSLIQITAIIISLISALFIFLTIISNKNLNQKLLFNEIVKQERELRILLNEYRKDIDYEKIKTEEDKIRILEYETLLFNYYEYLSICIYQKLIKEKEAKLFFKQLLKEAKEVFENSYMIEQGYAKREQYLAIQWLFKYWNL